MLLALCTHTQPADWALEALPADQVNSQWLVAKPNGWQSSWRNGVLALVVLVSFFISVLLLEFVVGARGAAIMRILLPACVGFAVLPTSLCSKGCSCCKT